MSWYSNMLESSGCTYWSTSGTDDFGNTQFSDPQIIDCRWVDKQELFRDKEGNEVTSSAVVYLNQDIEMEGYLYHGQSSGSSPAAGAREIRGYAKSPSVDFGKYVRKVWL